MRRRRSLRSAIAATVVGLVAAGSFSSLAAATTSPRDGRSGRPVSCRILARGGRHAEQSAFTAAAHTTGVSRALLLAVSYLETRWDSYGAAQSSSGGYGPMNLTSGAASTKATPTLRLAARLTGLSPRRLTVDRNANICGGAAVLASFQRHARRGTSRPVGSRQPLPAWRAAVARYAGTGSPTARRLFVHQVFARLHRGQVRRTNEGQLVRLAAHRRLRVPRVRWVGASEPASTMPIDCPAILTCGAVPAAHARWGPDPQDYGTYDYATRPSDGLSIRYIVIHNRPGPYAWANDLATIGDAHDGAWDYTVRSTDGLVAQDVLNRDVGHQAGNWWFNLHSIGVEHESSVSGEYWTETEYETSAWLVEHLAREFQIPLDRAHIIGADEVPAGAPSTLAAMRTDPGPFWDWQHYMALLDAPIAGQETGQLEHRPFTRGEVVTVKSNVDFTSEQVTGCQGFLADICGEAKPNFVYVRQAPDDQAPLVSDPGLEPDGAASSTALDDVGARAVDGEQLVVTATSGDWLGVDWLGRTGWIKNGPTSQNVVPTPTSVLLATVRPGLVSAPLYGRAYPERSAYPSGVPYRQVASLPYRIPTGQSYVVADTDVPTDYASASYAGVVTPVTGHDVYDEVWFGHRLLFVRAADVTLSGGTLARADAGGAR